MFSESVSYQKKDGCATVRLSFGMTPTFQKKKKNQNFFSKKKKSVSYQKKGGHAHVLLV